MSITDYIRLLSDTSTRAANALSHEIPEAANASDILDEVRLVATVDVARRHLEERIRGLSSMIRAN